MHEALAKANFQKDISPLTETFAAKLRWTVNSSTFPILDITADHSRPVRFRFTCDNWDELAPSIEILNPDGSLWPAPLPVGGIFHNGPHPTTGKPFVCMRGSREFHNHPNHLSEKWDTYRPQEGMNLLGIMQQLVNYWREKCK